MMRQRDSSPQWRVTFCRRRHLIFEYYYCCKALFPRIFDSAIVVVVVQCVSEVVIQCVNEISPIIKKNLLVRKKSHTASLALIVELLINEWLHHLLGVSVT